MLSQLSYVPEKVESQESKAWKRLSRHWTLDSRQQMGVPGFEPGTSALSELRSNQLSYTPFAVAEFLRFSWALSSVRTKVSCIDTKVPGPELKL